MKIVEKSIKIGGRELTLSTGKLAKQATSAVMASYGETVVLATIVAAPLRDDPGYFPLNVNYQERLYAGGRIKGSRWVKREGRPTDDEILTSRLIDRSIRPLFPNGYKKDVQVIVTVMSVDMETSPDIVSSIAVSAAIEASTIPWNGPVAVTKIGRKEGKFVVNPTIAELGEGDMELVVSSTKDSVVMIEAGAKEVEEDSVLDGIKTAQKESDKVLLLIQDFAKEVGIKKEDFVEEKIKSEIKNEVVKATKKDFSEVLAKLARKEIGYSEYNEYKSTVLENFSEEELKDAGVAFEEVAEEIVRSGILADKRMDGRKSTDVRPLAAEVSLLPRTHGSGLFQRGETQVMSIATLGSSSLEQLIETAEGEEKKRYIHHYSMPPFSVGETGRVGFVNRREIGHGALAEKAIMPVLPSSDEFPYTMHVMSEVLSSNGSTSMASVCGSTLSLMDAGVPITSPVAGIAMGVVIESEKNYKVLSDITGLEDGNGDMDFKVAGTKKGITALQLDVKTLKVTQKILSDAVAQAKDVRIKILGVIAKAIKEPRKTLSQYAPKIKRVVISPEKIGELIGPGGKNIKQIMAETDTQIDVDDDGNVSISTNDEEGMKKAVEWVEALNKEIVAGEIYDGVVKRVEDYGAFVEILPGKDGMVHISDMSMDFVKNVADIVSLGDRVKVRVKEIDKMGRINLSMNLEGDPPKTGGRDGGDRGRDRGGRGGFGRNTSRPRGGNFRRDDRNQFSENNKNSGPHFPASRLMDSDKNRKKDF